MTIKTILDFDVPPTPGSGLLAFPEVPIVCRLGAWILVAAILSWTTARAQEITNSSPRQASSSPSDPATTGSDLGVQPLLEPRPRPRLFQISSDTQYLYDSNVLLVDGDLIPRGEDSVFIENLGVSFSPKLIYPLTSTLFYYHDLVRYDELSDFDFDSDTGGLRLSAPVKDWFTVYGGFSASRYYYRAGGHEFYKNYDTQFGLSREQPIGRRALLIYGYQLDWRPTSPSELTRLDNGGYLGTSVALMDKLTAQLFYRLRYREYLEADRHDLDHLVSLTLGYAFSQYVSLRVALTYGTNASNQNDHDYSVFTAGGGLNLNIKF